MQTLKKYWWLWLIIILLLVWYFWPTGAAAKKTTEQCEADIAEANKKAAIAKQQPFPNPQYLTCPHGEKKITVAFPIQYDYLKSKGWK